MEWPPSKYDWPLHEYSQRVQAVGHRWHVQIMGQGPAVVLLHGAGAGGQSWRNLAPVLAKRWQLIIPDLPGQGFSVARPGSGFGISDMSHDLQALLCKLDCKPAAIVGHSAGAVVALDMAKTISLKRVVAINPALRQFDGMAGWLYPAMARTLARVPFSSAVLARTVSKPQNIARLLAATGSRTDSETARLYGALAQDSAHIAGTLSMMAHWDLNALLPDLPNVTSDCLFLIGEKDGTVPPDVGLTAVNLLPNANAQTFPNLGHLAHEEDPEMMAKSINEFLNS